MILKEADRGWKHGELHAPLLDYFNITLPCGDSCPLRHARAGKCVLSDVKDKIFMDFTSPVINETLVLLEADPYRLLMRKDKQSCTVRYNCPENLVYSLTNQCIYEMNIDQPSKHDLLIVPQRACKPTSNLPDSSNYFLVDSCVIPDDALRYGSFDNCSAVVF
ncbi:unnamed protein product [Orchesella dallaii]|uniref:Uncharacterized protein n=1 Tax=Orchesella dallaii TaxID=48710 RepID=A0ABP1RK14_9HEXA